MYVWHAPAISKEIDINGKTNLMWFMFLDVHLDGSLLLFDDILKLVSFYCISRYVYQYHFVSFYIRKVCRNVSCADTCYRYVIQLSVKVNVNTYILYTFNLKINMLSQKKKTLICL